MRAPGGLAVASLLVALGAQGAELTQPPADLIVRGRIWTADPEQPWAEALAVRGERIVQVGASRDVLALRGPRTELLEAGDGLVTPGFNDAHLHLMSGALSLERVDLIEDQDLPAVQKRIADFTKANPERPWVLGRGWLYGSFPGGLPTREQLDAVVPDRPAYMECYDGHSGWANSRALALAGITKDTPDPGDGIIVRDPATGLPTGALKEGATALVESKLPRPDAQARYALLLKALALLNSQGLTSIQDAGGLATSEGRSEASENGKGDVVLLERARAEGRLSVRVRGSVVLSPTTVSAGLAQARQLAGEHHDALIRFGAVKGFVDGVVEAKTAAMLAPYDDGSTGLPNWTAEQLDAAVKAADAQGLQVWLHAIGDRGVRMALDAHQAALAANGRSDRRGRIEHIETISPPDYARFRGLGVIASMQPLHANPDQNNSDVWVKQAGPERAARGFSWGQVERAGGRLVFGSDWPVVTSDVLRGLYVAVTRQTREGRPPGGWLPEQAVTVEAALRHYTSDAAYASFEELDKGSLAAGKLADIVVLSADPFKLPPAALLQARVRATIMGGRVVYRAP